MSNINFYNVKSSDHFKELLSADLNRVSLINFWAPWAEPCKNMNEVVAELAKAHSELLVLQVKHPFKSHSIFIEMTFPFLSAIDVMPGRGVGRGRGTRRNLRII